MKGRNEGLMIDDCNMIGEGSEANFVSNSVKTRYNVGRDAGCLTFGKKGFLVFLPPYLLNP